MVSEIGYWFSSPYHTFLRVFDRQNSPHVLLRYATKKLFMKEVAYHLSIGFSTTLHRNKKVPSPTLPMQIRLDENKNIKVTNTKGKEIEKFSISYLDFNWYDPRNVFK